MKETIYSKGMRFWQDRRGSLTLEAAVLTPVVCLMLVFLLLTLYGRWARFIWISAGHKASQELALTAQLVGRGIDAIPLKGEFAKDFNRLPAELRSLGADGLATALGGPWVASHLNRWYNLETQGHPLLKRIGGHPKVTLEVKEREAVAWVHTYLNLNLGLRHWKPVVDIPVALWLTWPEAEGEGEGDEDSSGDDQAESVWEWTNFKRGHHFRSQYGGNLPPSFPVLSGYEHGEARMIRSLDLTAPTWQKPDYLQERLLSWGQRLQHFEGLDQPWGQAKIQIPKGSIQHRRLILIIPTNSPAEGVAQLNHVIQRLRAQGLEVDLHRDQESHRFDSPESASNGSGG